ncbi:hypothetical protein ACK56M_18070 [Pseudomonas sp. s4]|uniref:hypothetical protein n=1 Tax=Pseudomonas sp. s4 TaxID=353218 RepID=UPI00398CB2CB
MFSLPIAAIPPLACQASMGNSSLIGCALVGACFGPDVSRCEKAKGQALGGGTFVEISTFQALVIAWLIELLKKINTYKSI